MNPPLEQEDTKPQPKTTSSSPESRPQEPLVLDEVNAKLGKIQTSLDSLASTSATTGADVQLLNSAVTKSLEEFQKTDKWKNECYKWEKEAMAMEASRESNVRTEH